MDIAEEEVSARMDEACMGECYAGTTLELLFMMYL